MRRRRINKWLFIAGFVLPGMIIFFLFFIMPISQSFYFSVFDWDGFGPPTDFIGLGNFERLLRHGVFQQAVIHSFIIMILSLVVQLPMALGLALLVGRGNLRGRKVFRTILFVPYVFSEIITALIFRYAMHPTNGLFNWVGSFFPGFEPIPWLADQNIALYAIFFVLTWKFFGFHMILYMAGLQGIPPELEDAARIDGATEFQVLRKITLPLLGSTIRLTTYLSVLGSFQQFALVWVLTEGGPVNSTELFATYLYKYGIQRFHLGYGSAVAVVLFAITLVFSLGYQRIVMRQDYVLSPGD